MYANICFLTPYEYLRLVKILGQIWMEIVVDAGKFVESFAIRCDI